jgi:hypothetical protein
MLHALLKRRHSAAHIARVTGHIDDGIELHACERREAVRFVSIYTDMASTCWNRSSNSSCGAGDVMARCEGMGGNRSPQKLRTSKDQQAHLCTPELRARAEAAMMDSIVPALRGRSTVANRWRQGNLDPSLSSPVVTKS